MSINVVGFIRSVGLQLGELSDPIVPERVPRSRAFQPGHMVGFPHRCENTFANNATANRMRIVGDLLLLPPLTASLMPCPTPQETEKENGEGDGTCKLLCRVIDYAAGKQRSARFPARPRRLNSPCDQPFLARESERRA